MAQLRITTDQTAGTWQEGILYQDLMNESTELLLKEMRAVNQGLRG